MKGEMRFSGLVFSIIIGLGVMIGMGTFMGSLGNSYNRDVNTTFVENSKQMADNMNQSAREFKEISGTMKEGELSFLDQVYGGFKMALVASGTMFQMSGDIMVSFPAMLFETTTTQGFPPSWFIGLVFLSILFVVIFAWLNWGRGTGKI